MVYALISLASWLGGFVALVVVMGNAAVASEPAALPSWYTQPYPYLLVDQDLRAALAEFGEQLNLVVVPSDKVRGRSQGNLRAETAGQFLTLLSDTSNLTWYFDGNVLYVHTDAEGATRVFSRTSVDLTQLTSWLNTLDVSGKQLSVRGSADGSELLVFGPPPYLALVQQHVDQQRQPETAVPVLGHVMRVYRGSNVSEVSMP